MKTYPLKSLTMEEATKKQFQLVDAITQVFQGAEFLTRGDLGVVPGYNQPITTHKVEEVLATFFQAEAAMLVRGAGTTAIRLALHASIPREGTILVHDAPIYPTTQTSFEMLGLKVVKADFNNSHKVKEVLQHKKMDGVLIQLTRQKPDDSYDSEEIIQMIKEQFPDLPIITDDNYAVLKVAQMGTEQGASLSCFSTFKVLGPEGVGCIVGQKKFIEKLRKENYSGGLQVQGHESLDVLRGMVYAPVSLALSAQVAEETCARLNKGELPEVKEAFLANAQSKVILVTFNEPIAKSVLKKAEELGAAPNPIGAESKYEIIPMFYKVSGTFRQAMPEMDETTIRINPMRSGADTIIRILREAINDRD